MKKHQGFVLLMVLIFMQIYALLGITALEQVFLAEKLTSDQKARRLLLNEAEHLLQQLEVSFSPLCLILATSSLPTRPLSWWAAFSCAEIDHFFNSYYVVEDLGTDPCALIRGEAQIVATYYRITVLLMNGHDERLKVMLQSTVVKGAQTLEHCGSEQHYVDLGAQSWHEL